MHRQYCVRSFFPSLSTIYYPVTIKKRNSNGKAAKSIYNHSAPQHRHDTTSPITIRIRYTIHTYPHLSIPRLSTLPPRSTPCRLLNNHANAPLTSNPPNHSLPTPRYMAQTLANTVYVRIHPINLPCPGLQNRVTIIEKSPRRASSMPTASSHIQLPSDQQQEDLLKPIKSAQDIIKITVPPSRSMPRPSFTYTNPHPYRLFRLLRSTVTLILATEVYIGHAA